MRLAIVGILLLLTSSAGFAANSKQQPMKITSDASTVDRAKGIATFTGHVVFVQDTTKVTGDKMVVYFDKGDQLQKVVITGNLAKAWISSGKAQSPIASQAQTIIYQPEKSLVQLKGQAEANQNGNIMRGPLLVYNTQTQVLTSAQGSDNTGRTVIILQPKTAATMPTLLTPVPASSTRPSS